MDTTPAGSMTFAVVMSFGPIDRRHEPALEHALRRLPALAGDLFVSCDVGVRAACRSLTLRLTLWRGPCAEATVQRLAFWSARAGGVAISLRREPAPSLALVGAALEVCDPLHRELGMEQLGPALDRAFDALWPGIRRVRAVGASVLTIPWKKRSTVAPDVRRRLIAIEGTVAPPNGEAFVLAVGAPADGGPALQGGVRVVGSHALPRLHAGDAPRIAILLRADDGAFALALGRALCPGRRSAPVARAADTTFGRPRAVVPSIPSPARASA